MQPSPYTPGAVAPEVAGRAAQLSEIDERLSYLVDLQRLVGRIRVDHGARGIGKTSLLRQAQRMAEQRGAATIWITAGEERGLVREIAKGIELAGRHWGAGRRRLKASLDALNLNLKVNVLVATAEVGRTGRRPDEAAPTGARELEELLKVTHEVAAKHDRSGLVLFVDEVQNADRAGLRTLAYAWQHLQSESAHLPAAVFAAGLPNSPQVINGAVTNSERFAYRQLGALDRNGSLVALAAPARNLGVRWTDAALDRAVDYADGYPHTLQLVGDFAWAVAGRPDRGGVIEDAHVIAALPAVEADLEQLFESRYLRITRTEERSFVQAMAQLGDGPISRERIATTLGVRSAALSRPREQLIAAGVITTAGRGSVAFTVPGFAEHLRRHHPLSTGSA